MRRFVGLTVLLFLALPLGLSVTGCGHKTAPVQYCNAGDSGPVVGQVAQIVLSQSLATIGESLNYGQIGQTLSASAQDCKGNTVSVPRYTYASTSSFINSANGTVFADINPSSGQVCAGTWNRNLGGGIPDYTLCAAPTSPTNYVPTVVTPGGSPYTYVAPTAGTLTVGGGTVSSIVVTPSGGQAATQKYTSGLFNVGVGDAVTITYSSVPTLELFAPNALSPVTVGALSTFVYTATQAGTVAIATTPTTTTSPTGVEFVYLTHAGVLTLQPAGSTTFPVSAGDSVTIAFATTPSLTFTPTTPASSPAQAIPLTASTVPAFAYTSTSGGTLALGGGTIQELFVTHNGTSSLQSSTSGLFALSAGDAVSLVYTAAPTIGFNPYGAVAYVTATAAGATSNAIAVYVHPTATAVVLGGASASCVAGQGVGTDCCPNTTVGTTVTAPVYNGNGASCLSQNHTGQLVARVYQNGATNPANDITCQVGHLTYGVENASNVVAIDQNGIATANQPGSTEITATIAQSSTATNAGFFSTCPPASITLAAQGYPNASSVNVSLNNVQPLTATVVDTQGFTITGLALEYNSTQPQLIPGGAGSITPVFPGTATITAACQPGTCNPSGFTQIGVLGNGKPITSNGITINTAGHSGTVVYAGSTATATSAGSQYLFVQDSTTVNSGALIKLPYVPNSIAITLNGSAIYMGSAGGLMTFSTASNTVTSTNQVISGQVLSISPDSTTLVTTDPVRQTISLVAAGGSVITSYGGIGTHAAWSPDTQSVYITTTTGAILTHSTFTNWQPATSNNGQVYNDVAVTVPSVGAFFAGPLSTDGRSYCSNTTAVATGNPPTATNIFLPFAAQVTAPTPVTGRIAATNDGLHILEANITTAGAPTFTDLDVAIPVQACPAVIPAGYFGTGNATTLPTTPLGVAATSITGVLPANNSAIAFVTYNGTSGLLPYYLVPATGTGTLSYLKLQNGATAPLAGVLSTDNLTLYVGTAGDNAVHEIGITYPAGGAPVVVDTAAPLTPNLPSASGTGTVPANLLVQYPKKSTT